MSQTIEARKLTGCISIEYKDEGYTKYGTIQFLKGELIAAEYGIYKGEAAFNIMNTLYAPKLSFAQGALLLKPQEM